MRTTRSLLIAIAAFATTGCSDVPLMPTWDTEWSFPLVSRTTDQLFGTFTVTVHPGASIAVAFPADQIHLDERLQQIIGRQMTKASLVVTISKALAVGGSYTLAVSRDSAGLQAAPDSGIALRFSILQPSLSVTDSSDFSVAGLAMLQAVANANGSLWVQLRGTTTFNGPGTLTIAPTDSITVQLTLRATISTSN